MNGRYGGMTLDMYAKKNFKRNLQTHTFETKFLSLMKSMKPLFYGLVEMEKHKIIHCDIKFNNIVYDKDEFKYIDFGLSGTIKDKNDLKERSMGEFYGD